MQTNTKSHREAESASAYFAGQCRTKLRDCVGEGRPITTQTLSHADGSFSAQAFHTVWSDPDRDDFAREVVNFSAYEGEDHSFTHGVEYYYDGRHDVYCYYELGQIEE